MIAPLAVLWGSRWSIQPTWCGRFTKELRSAFTLTAYPPIYPPEGCESRGNARWSELMRLSPVSSGRDKPGQGARYDSHRVELPVGRRRQLDPDRVAFADLAALQHDPHDPGLADQVAIRIARQGRRHQPGLQLVELAARVAQAGHLNDRILAQMEPRPGRQPEQIDSLGRDVLAHLPGGDRKPGTAQFVEQLG